MPDNPYTLQHTYTAKTIANLLGVSTQRVWQLLQDGIIPADAKAGRNKYFLEGCVKGYLSYLRDRAVGRGVTTDDLQGHKTRLTAAQADKAELEASRAKGEMIEVDAVAQVVEGLIADSKMKLLAIPIKAAPLVIGVTSLPEIQETLTVMVTDALDELTKNDPVEICGTGVDGMETTPPIDGHPME